jgi:DNA replication protein DnaC
LTLDEDLAKIIASANARFEAGGRFVDGEAPAPSSQDLNAERLERRAKAMAANGWERRVLALVTGKASTAYEETRASAYLNAMRSVDTDDGGIVVLAGNVGSGKTAAAARWSYTRTRNAPRFLRSSEFFRSSRYLRDDAGDSVRDDLLRQQALVLDDVGAEYADANGNYRVDLDELIDRFYADRRVLVMTTNIAYATPEQRERAKASGVAVDENAATFVDRYGERVTDRLRECGRWVDAATASMRRRS